MAPMRPFPADWVPCAGRRAALRGTHAAASGRLGALLTVLRKKIPVQVHFMNQICGHEDPGCEHFVKIA